MQTIERSSSPKLVLRLSAGIALAAAALTSLFFLASAALPLRAQASGPTMLVPNLGVRTAVNGLVTPIGL
ncbi:MAG TPA: hypothetical protein VGK08_00295, partial [Thermoanaerobaculia bacterium]